MIDGAHVHTVLTILGVVWSCYLVSEVLQLVFPFFLIWSQFFSTLVCFDVPIHGDYMCIPIEASFNTSLGLTQCVTLTQTTVVPTGPTQ